MKNHPAFETSPRAMRVADLMTVAVIAADASEEIDLASAEMKWSHIRHLPVVDGHGRLLGLVYASDLRAAVKRVAVEGKLPLRAVMRQNVLTSTRETPLADAIRLMLESKVTALPVVDAQERLVGILTESDFVRHVYAQLTGSRYSTAA